MRRRDFVALLGGLVTSTPLFAGAQPSSQPVIGFLASGSPEMFANQLAKFRLGLTETGFVEGQNVRVQYRWAQGQFDLAGLRVAAIAATGGSAPARAAKAATREIPIVFTSGSSAHRATVRAATEAA